MSAAGTGSLFGGGGAWASGRPAATTAAPPASPPAGAPPPTVRIGALAASLVDGRYHAERDGVTVRIDPYRPWDTRTGRWIGFVSIWLELPSTGRFGGLLGQSVVADTPAAVAEGLEAVLRGHAEAIARAGVR